MEADIAALDRDGCVLLPHVLNAVAVDVWRSRVASAFPSDAAGVCHRDSSVYAARGVLQLIPDVVQLVQFAPLPRLLTCVLGPGCGLVRALYFDKPPNQTWGLPWHKDLKIAVQPNPPPSDRYSTPRDRSGTPHAEAPVEVLERMLTLRFHLDAMTSENGPLEVWPGSHPSRKSMEPPSATKPVSILGDAGDVFVMRPLLMHCSGRSAPGCTLHRRILHLEFASADPLPDAWQWHDFQTLPA